MTAQEVLQQCTVEGMIIKLPAGELERSLYLEVKKSLELIGGKWKGGKTQGFVFEEDPTELLEALANGEQRNLKKEYQFFPTPSDVADRMIELIPFIDSHHKILEPSAGDGAIIKRIREYASGGAFIEIDCYELLDLNQMKLTSLSKVNILGSDFLACDLKDTYDVVIANPPFTKNQDIDHIGKMWEVVKPGGVIVTLASCSWTFGSQKKQEQFRNWLNEINAEQYEIEEGAFKESGTAVKTVLLKIVKPVIYNPVPWEIKKSSTTTQSEIADKEMVENKVEEVSANEEETLPVRTCRVCGCTDDDCRQCIKKTGQPCHWVEDDLCSACQLPAPKEILKQIKESNKEFDKSITELENLLTNNNDDMNFFQMLALQTGGVDMTIRIMTKNNSMTLNIMPGSGSSTTKPLLITGTPTEIDEQFFDKVMPGYNEVKGLVTNIDEVKAELTEKAAAKEKKPAAAKPSKKAEPKKAEAKKEIKAEEPQLFE